MYPARAEGLPDVFDSPNFILTKARWVADDEVTYCVLCNNKFNQLRRKHHCRQCGRILCNKCCKEKVPLPQLGVEEPEKVCESCRPVVEMVTKSRSPLLQCQNEAALGLVKLLIEPHGLCKVVELGGLQTLVALARIDNETLVTRVVNGLHLLSMHQPLHRILVEIGAVHAVCSILMRSSTVDEQVQVDGISTLMILCKSPELRTKVVGDGALNPVLKLCSHGNREAVALLSVSTLSLITENQATHAKVVESEHNVLSSILNLTTSADEQMQEVSLKVLVFISLGSVYHMHRIIQEDFTSGRSLLKAIKSRPKNDQVLVNAACVISNLATSADNQGGLQEVMECLCNMLKSDTNNTALIIQVARGIANFAKFQQNADRLMKYLPVIVFRCLKSSHHILKMHGMRATLHLLTHNPVGTTRELISDGAGQLLECMARLPGLTAAVEASLLTSAPDKTRP